MAKSVPIACDKSVPQAELVHKSLQKYIIEEKIRQLAIEKYRDSGYGITFEDVEKRFNVKKGKACKFGFYHRDLEGTSEEDQMTIGKGLRKREQDQVYIDIFRLVFAQHLNCDARFPTVNIHKIIFIDSLRDKQFLFDSVFDLMHSMLLVESRFSELINQFYPKGEE